MNIKLSRLLLIFIACAAIASGCTDSEDSQNGRNSKTGAELSRDSVIWMATSDAGEQSQLITHGNAKHTFVATITEGAEFCSFRLTQRADSYTGPLGDVAFIYLDANMTNAVRTATIEVAFSDGTPAVALQLTQQAYNSSAKYDQHDWAELPQYADNGDYIYKTYYTTLTSGVSRVRNYSICFDSQRHVSHWVAYPVHSCYTTPRFDRKNPWAYDDAVTEPSSDASGYKITGYNITQPEIPKAIQQNIISTYGTGHQRGHMLPSASRYSNWDTNAQTFYATNMMPQNGDFNGGVWATLEGIVRDNGGTGARDTLYVVTGTWFGDDYTITDRSGLKIAVPSHAYKVLLKARNRIPEGKTIADLDASELKAIGFWFPNPRPNDRSNTTVAEAMCSVAEIEAKTGFDYFRTLKPEVAEAVKRQCRAGDWSGLQ